MRMPRTMVIAVRKAISVLNTPVFSHRLREALVERHGKDLVVQKHEQCDNHGGEGDGKAHIRAAHAQDLPNK